MSLADLRQRALEALQRGDLGSAVDCLQTAVHQQPDEVELYHDLADCLWTAYQFDRALAIYQEANHRRPDSVATCVAAAQKLFGIARFQESLQWLERALGNSPGEASIFAMLAEVSERRNSLADAERYAQAALAIEPGHVKSIRILAHVEFRRGRPEAACRRLRIPLVGPPSPDHWRLRYELATILDQMEEYPAALAELLAAKAQLSERALPLWAEAQAIQRRQRELARQLSRADFEGWRTQSTTHARPIAFLCGHPRSGTTLLEQILGMHDRVITTDETGVLRREFIQPLLRNSASASENAAELRGLEDEQIVAGRETYLRFTEAHLGEPIGARWLIEKDPALTPDLPLPLRLFPEAQVIFPLRDPRDVCLSYFFTLVPLAVPSAAALDMRATCESCAHSLAMWTHWKEVLPFPLLETRYENLVTAPNGEIRRVLEFLKLPWTPAVLDFTERSRTKGIRTPTYANVTQPLYQRAIGRWKNYEALLTPHLHLLQPYVRAFGYE